MKNLLLSLVVFFTLSCGDNDARRRVRASSAMTFTTTLYPGWTVLGVVASAGCTEPSHHVSVTVQDPKTGAIHRLALKCYTECDEPFCIENLSGC